MLLRMPIAYSMMIIGTLGISILNSPAAAFRVVPIELYATFSSYSLSVVPMFIWMGYIAYHSGIGSKLYDFMYKLVGHLPGGLALSTQGTAALFGAICGSNTATSATIGAISIPEMKKWGYDDSLSTASVAAGGILGVLIPPSVLFIIYGIATEQSIGKLFVAGIVPGILLTIFFMITIAISVYRHPEIAPRGERSTWSERIAALRSGGLWEVIIVFVLSLGGLFLGWFTPTEAGAVGVAGILVITLLTRQLKWEGLKRSLYDTTRTIAMIMFLVVGAVIYGRFISITRIPFELASWIGDLPLPPFAIMAFILLIYLILGCFIDALAMILLTIPIFYPVVTQELGYDPIWFGVIIVLVGGMGVITPPVGINVYVIKGVAKDVPLEVIFRGIWPFLYAIIVMLIIFVTFPDIVTWLPNLID
jgi:tripartite ATP-independent transporter DctM subunit